MSVGLITTAAYVLAFFLASTAIGMLWVAYQLATGGDWDD